MSNSYLTFCVFLSYILFLCTSCILRKETKLYLTMIEFIKWFFWYTGNYVKKKKSLQYEHFFMLHFQRLFLELKLFLFHKIIKFTSHWLLTQNTLQTSCLFCRHSLLPQPDLNSKIIYDRITGEKRAPTAQDEDSGSDFDVD